MGHRLTCSLYRRSLTRWCVLLIKGEAFHTTANWLLSQHLLYTFLVIFCEYLQTNTVNFIQLVYTGDFIPLGSMNKSLLDIFVPSKVLSQALDTVVGSLRVFPFTRVKFKRNERLLVSATKVTIECFFKKIFNSYVYLSADNDRVNN